MGGGGGEGGAFSPKRPTSQVMVLPGLLLVLLLQVVLLQVPLVSLVLQVPLQVLLVLLVPLLLLVLPLGPPSVEVLRRRRAELLGCCVLVILCLRLG